MRTLILTGPATDEQRAISQALKNALAARGSSSLSVSALALLGQHAPLSQTTAMEQEALLTPRAFAFLSDGGTFLRGQKRKSIVYEVNAKYAQNLHTLLAEGEFDAVLCLHRYPAEAITFLRKQLTFSARCYFVSVDFACIPFLEETSLDAYFIAHEALRAPYVRRGLPEKKLVPTGIPLPTAWFRAEERADARALLDLPQGVPCYFILSATDPAAAANALLARLNGADARVCVTMPQRFPLRGGAQRQASEIRLVSVDPDDGPALYRNACNVLLALPSGAVSAAAAVAGVPLVHLPPRDDSERQTARFFSTRGMSAAGGSLDEAADLAVVLARNEAQRNEMLSAQRGVCPPDAAERMIRFLYEGKCF